MRVSVIICTWNRAKDLDRTLSEFSSLEIPEGVEWELLVVNNNCTDNTDEVISTHATRLPLRRYFEPTPGLSSARNCGMSNAFGDLIIWTDDDVLVDPKWLAEYVAAARAWPEAQFFGGFIEPLFAEPPPTWIEQNLKLLNGPFAICDLGGSIRPLAPDEFVFGANMGYRREPLLATCFNTSLGRVGNQLISGEDMAMVQHLRNQGFQGIWIGTARVRHMIPASRMKAAYSWKWFKGAGRTEIRELGIKPARYVMGIPIWLIRRILVTLPKAGLFTWFHLPGCFLKYHQLAVYLGMVHEIKVQRKQKRREQ